MSKKFVVRGNTPPEMNFNSSKNIAEIQEFNNRQIYTKGFRQNTAVGTNNSYSFNLGGKARQLHGLIIIFPTAPQKTTFSPLSRTLHSPVESYDRPTKN